MNIFSKHISLFGITLLFFFSTAVFADVWDRLESHSLENKENEGIEDFIWKESGDNLPDYPQEGNLLEVAGPPTHRNYQYFIDEKSITTGADGVVRFSIIIRSPGGVDNVMYDGIRCTTEQIKHYAYGSMDMEGNKKLILKQSSNWQDFRSVGVTGYAPILNDHYLCCHNGANISRNEIIQNIKYGKGPVDGFYD
jgi:hypothetical protein